MSKPLVTDLNVGDSVAVPFVIREMNLAPFRDPKKGKYLNLILGDRSGQIAARMWDNAEPVAAKLQVGQVVTVTGRVEEYQGQAQLIVQRLQICPPERYDAADFVPCSKRSREEMVEQLQANIAEVDNEYLRAVLEGVFGDEELLDRFATAPGAKTLHHAYRGGLLEHTLSVVELVKKAQELHPQLDRDLLITAGLLHDLGKIRELGGELAYEYTDVGGFVGHVVLTDRMVTAKLAQIPDFPPHLADLLSHALLSHHGQREWGAPVVPATPEACALHYADNLDARVAGFQSIIDQYQDQPDRWSRYHPYFERRIFVGSDQADEEEES